jgi:hypothetical protein
MRFGEGCPGMSVRRVKRLAVILDGVTDSGGDLVAGSVGEADVQDAVAVAAGEFDSLVDCSQDIGFEQIQSAQNAHFSSVTIQEVSVLRHLRQLHFGHIHECIDLELGPLEILDTECVDGDDLNATLVADFQNLGKLSVREQKVQRSELSSAGVELAR